MQHQSQQHQHQGPFCPFCHNRDPRSGAKYTHCLKNPDGSPQCPFLKVTMCTRCHMFGHTAKHCCFKDDCMRHEMDVIQLDMECRMSIKGTKTADDQPSCAHLEPTPCQLELMQARERLWGHFLSKNANDARWAKIQEYMHTGKLMEDGIDMFPNYLKFKGCMYCYNHDKWDPTFMTHRVGCCPRLACTKCRTCGELGHTQAKCEKPLIDRLMQEAMETGEYDEWWIDFDDEDEPAPTGDKTDQKMDDA